MSFPVYLRVGSVRLHPHIFFEILAYVVGFGAYFWFRRRRGDAVSADERWWVIAAAFAGAALGSTLLAMLENPAPWTHPPGKTIVGGLAGGWLAVEWVKKLRHISVRTGDLLAVPLALAIAVGRIGCFLTGLSDQTYGNQTSLGWGVNFGDGVPRHPTQLYEVGFLLALSGFLLITMRRPHRNGAVFRIFMASYMGWRLLVDFIKPGYRFVGLTAIQWSCAAVLLYCVFDLVVRPRTRPVATLDEENAAVA